MKKITIVIATILMLLLTGCSDIGIEEVKKSDEIMTLLKGESKEATFVYFGRPTCPYCQKFHPKLDNVVEKKEMKVLYYNTDEHRDDSDFDQVLAEYKVEQIPYLAKVENGKIVAVLNDAKTEQDILNFIK